MKPEKLERKIDVLLFPGIKPEDWQPIATAPANRGLLVRCKRGDYLVMTLESEKRQFDASPRANWGRPPNPDAWTARVGEIKLTFEPDKLEAWCWIPGIHFQ
jgi:hypothetical protein